MKLRLSEIKWYEKNNKDHPKQQIDLLKKMISEYGYDSPIIVNKDWIVIAGHWRLQALIELTKEGNNDYLEVDVIVKDKLTKKQEQKYRLLDNKIAELAINQIDNINIELEELQDEELNSLYSDIDIQTDEEEAREEIEDNIPEIPKAMGIINKWDVIELWRHRLMCGDSTSKEDVDKLMDGKKADMVFTDPPYWVSYTGWLQFKEWKVEKNNRQMIKNDEIDIYWDIVPLIFEVCKWPCYIWFADTKATNLYNYAEQYWDIHAQIIWVKNGWYWALNANYKQKHEPCLYCKAKDWRLNFIWNSTETTIWEINKDWINKLHPTQKPIVLAEKAISNHEAKIVLDLFLWSWSTLIASEKTNRICYWMELDEHYCEVIIQRYTDYVKDPTIKINWVEQNRSDLVTNHKDNG